MSNSKTDDRVAIQVKLTPTEVAEIDRIRSTEPGIPTRAEMARRLVTGEAVNHLAPQKRPAGGKS